MLQLEEQQQIKAQRNQDISSIQSGSSPVGDDPYEATVIVPTKPLDRDTSLYEVFISLLRSSSPQDLVNSLTKFLTIIIL